MVIAKSVIFTDDIRKSMFTQSKSGRTMLPVTITIYDEPDQYGNNVKITLEQTEDERKGGVAKVYLGQGKVVFEKVNEAPAPQNTTNSDDALFS